MPAVRFLTCLALAAAMCSTATVTHAFDESKYPDFMGQWKRPSGIGNLFDGTNRRVSRTDPAPLTPEYQAIFEANRKDQAEGGQGTDPTFRCIPDGMPRAMNVIFPMEIVVMPKTTYIMIEYLSMLRRVFTDGRSFPEEFEPSFMGYTIGKWVDEDGDGKYDVLEAETRLLKGPRAFDATGIPLHADNQTVVKERFFLDKGDKNVLHDDITTIDHALTRPWLVHKTYVRVKKPIFIEAICAEQNDHVRLGKEDYMISADGYLMPAKKDQHAPDLRYFNKAKK